MLVLQVCELAVLLLCRYLRYKWSQLILGEDFYKLVSSVSRYALYQQKSRMDLLGGGGGECTPVALARGGAVFHDNAKKY